MLNRIAIRPFAPKLFSILISAVSVLACCGFLLTGLTGCKRGDESKTNTSTDSGNGSKGAATKPEVVNTSGSPVATQPSTFAATKPAVFPAEMVTDYLTVSLRMVNWYQKAPVPDFREQSDTILQRHGLQSARPPDTMLLYGDSYHLVDGKAGTDLGFNDNWFDPVAFFCGRRGDFPDIEVRRGSISVATQGSTFRIEIEDGIEVRMADGCFVRRAGEWIREKTVPSFSDSDIHKLGDLEFLKKKVTTTAEANANDHNGRSCLLRACEIDGLPSVKYLVEMGADINCVYQRTSTTAVSGIGVSVMEYRETALTTALLNERWETAHFLVEKGADVNFRGETVGSAGFIIMPVEIVPLVCAAGAGQEKLVNLMLSKHANVNLMGSHTDSSQNTALMAAAANNHPNIVKMLLAAEADSSIKNWNGETALQIARNKNLKEIAGLIESAQTPTPK